MTVTRNISNLTYFRGRVALYAILKGLNIGAGDEVVIQAFTCLAVPEGVMASGARPVYVDIETAGFNMDPADLERKLTPQVRAIVVQHTYGIPADMRRIVSIAQERGIPIIEDCCHTLASTYKGRPVGSFGTGSFYSFEWGKPVVAGIGGSAVVNDPQLKERVKAQYEHYRYPGFVTLARIQLQYYAFKILYRPSLYWPVRSAFHRLGSLGLAESNYNPVGVDNIAEDFRLRMAPPLQRRLARQLTKLDDLTCHSQQIAKAYREQIRSAAVTHPVLPEGADPVFARYPLLARNKQRLLQAARKANVELAEWYATPVHPLTGDELRLVGYEPGSCPNAEARCGEVVTLPTHPAVGKKDIERIISFLNEVEI